MLSEAKKFLNAEGETLVDRLEQMSDEELSRLRDGCNELTNTNCWWLAYQLAPAVREAIKVILHSREYKARRAALEAQHDE